MYGEVRVRAVVAEEAKSLKSQIEERSGRDTWQRTAVQQ